ncbi:MAG: DUF4105 domain-containing protein [Gemmatimonadota bacterium]
MTGAARRRLVHRILPVAFAALVLGLVAWSRVRPSNARDWLPEQAVMPRSTFDGNHVRIEGFRNWDWRGPGEPVSGFETREYDLDRIESVWYVVTPFSRKWRGAAHSFLSFGFADSQFVAISVEARKEIGESYSIVGGLLKRYEIMYVVGDERDLIGQRVFRNDDEVDVYPVRATPDAIRQLFIEMLERANELAEVPEFYGTLRNNCTTNILQHVNRLAPEPIPFGPRVLLPGWSDGLALERGLLDTELSLEAARERFLVNDRVGRFIDRPDFSAAIRR